MRRRKHLFDSSGWDSEKEAQFENLAPATGLTPLPISFLQLTTTLALASMSLNPWLRLWMKPHAK
jgi:hypothetical protein